MCASSSSSSSSSTPPSSGIGPIPAASRTKTSDDADDADDDADDADDDDSPSFPKTSFPQIRTRLQTCSKNVTDKVSFVFVG